MRQATRHWQELDQNTKSVPTHCAYSLLLHLHVAVCHIKGCSKRIWPECNWTSQPLNRLQVDMSCMVKAWPTKPLKATPKAVYLWLRAGQVAIAVQLKLQ